MRLFVAIDLPEKHKAELAPFLRLAGSQEPYFRWVAPESLHLTLRFIGEVKQDRVAAIDATLREIRQQQFTVNLRGFGIFGPVACPHVVWGRVVQGIEGICPLAAEVTNRLQDLGLRFRDRSMVFQPHVTLGLRRFQQDDTPQDPHPYPPVELEVVLDRLGPWMATEFVLLESYKDQVNELPYTRYDTLGRYALDEGLEAAS